jgi:hypothetical protein
MISRKKFPWKKLIAPLVGAVCGQILVMVIDSESWVPRLLVPLFALIAWGADKLLSSMPEPICPAESQEQPEPQPVVMEEEQVQNQPIPEPTPVDPASLLPIWWYASQGERIGPLSLTKMRDLIQSGKITLETKVWNGEGDWRLAKETELGALFTPTNSPTVPPPLTGSDIDNKFVWAVIAVQLIGVFVEIFLQSQMWIFYLIVNTGLCLLDEWKLKRAGYNPPNGWWTLLVPVYLWKRSTVLKQNRMYFWLYNSALVASAALSVLISMLANENRLAEAARPIVTQIVRDQWLQTAECKSVSIYDNISPGLYRATATLDDGRTFWVSIEDRGSSIYVTPLNLPVTNSY